MTAFTPLIASGGAGLPKPGQVNKPAKPPKPPSIISVALQNHPAWAGVPKPPPVPKPQTLKPQVPKPASGLASTIAQAPQQGSTPSGQSQAPTGAADQTSPLDATYYQNVANQMFKTNNTVNADQAKIGNDQTALQAALGQLAYQQPRSQLALEQKANAGGGLYSSVYNQNLADLNQKYLTQQNAAQTKYGGDIQALTAAIAGLQGGIPLYENQQAEASAQRAATAAQKNPSLGGTLPAPAAPTPAAAKTKTVGGGKVKTKASGGSGLPGHAALGIAKLIAKPKGKK